MYIIGISAFYHDSAICILKNGKILECVQEERFTRIKHDERFPNHCIEYCANKYKIKLSEINNFVFYEKPIVKFERILETYFAFAPFGFKSFVKSMPVWVKNKLFQKQIIIKELSKHFENQKDIKEKLLFCDHHLSHSASAFFPSPFKNAAILTMDGVGEWKTTSISLGRSNNIEEIKSINFPHSIGLLYSAFTYFCGFKVNSGEYKLMGLAPYGNPKYVDLIKDNLIDLKEDGSFKLNIKYFDYCTGLKMINSSFEKLFGFSARQSESIIEQKIMDVAASIQMVTEEIVIKIARNIKKETGQKNLCLAGGVALNCVANGLLVKEKIFENIWIQPASGDAGGALGAALFTYFQIFSQERKTTIEKDSMQGSFLGPKYNRHQIKETLLSNQATFKEIEKDQLIKIVARQISKGKIIGWMNGRMEFGPRALGCRSILADPRSQTMQKNLNLKIKYRESFRPFAPAILDDHLKEWFNLKVKSPYMLLVSSVKEKIKKNQICENKFFGIEQLNQIRSSIPSVTHVDFSSRIQTVHKETNSDFHKLISEFHKITGVPILINTSFNIRGEPIVCSPQDAFRCFMGTEMDILVIENFILQKTDQKNELKKNYIRDYDLD